MPVTQIRTNILNGSFSLLSKALGGGITAVHFIYAANVYN